MSDGSRSGVNWTRLNSASIDCASALASVVLPVPGKSSSNTCPPPASAASTTRRAADLPRITVSTLRMIRCSNCCAPTSTAAVSKLKSFQEWVAILARLYAQVPTPMCRVPGWPGAPAQCAAAYRAGRCVAVVCNANPGRRYFPRHSDFPDPTEAFIMKNTILCTAVVAALALSACQKQADVQPPPAAAPAPVGPAGNSGVPAYSGASNPRVRPRSPLPTLR